MIRKNIWLILEKVGVTLIISFMMLLILAAVLLAFNNEDCANKFAEIAYYMLVGGVITQLILLVKNKEHNS